MTTVEIVAYRHSVQSMNKCERSIVEERPIKFIVNGAELLTLMASPHELRFLVTGFLYQQGFFSDLADLKSLGVCEEGGLATISIAEGAIPEQLVPILTSGCGQAISYNPPIFPSKEQKMGKTSKVAASTIIQLMQELQKKAERYREHGGIHSAGIGNETGLLLHAEDLGRNNTIDRLTGEALFRHVDTRGAILVTSGRISSELAIKGVRLGVSTIATYTTATDRAIPICHDAGITLIGYLRGKGFEVLTHPQQLTCG